VKITKRQLRRIIKEDYNSMSSAGKALANSIKGKFMRMYPDAKVGIDGRDGFITVNGKKAIDMSQATGRGMSDDEMIEMMHAVHAETQVDDDVPASEASYRTTRPGEHKLDFGKDIGTYNYRNEGAKLKITKRQLRKIIREQAEDMAVDNNTHHWPRVDWSNVGELVDKWAQGEEKAFDKNDMADMGDTVTDAKRNWGLQVDQASMEMEAEMTARVRKVALQTMQEFTDKLLNKDYA